MQSDYPIEYKSAGVAYALVRAASRLISTHGSCTLRLVMRRRRRDESRRGTHVRTPHLPAITLKDNLSIEGNLRVEGQPKC